jgi:hypothetical protein
MLLLPGAQDPPKTVHYTVDGRCVSLVCWRVNVSTHESSWMLDACSGRGCDRLLVTG